MNIPQSYENALRHPNHPNKRAYSYARGRFSTIGRKSDKVRKLFVSPLGKTFWVRSTNPHYDKAIGIGLYPDGSRKLYIRMAEDCDPGELFLRILTGNEELREGILDALSVYLSSLSPEEAITKLSILEKSVELIRDRHLVGNKRIN